MGAIPFATQNNLSMAKKKSGSSSIGLIAFLLFLFGGALAVFLFLQIPFEKGSTEVRGIDVSHFQGKINWKKVRKEGIRFAYIKATEGITLDDEDFKYNWKKAGEEKILRGAYHFFIPSIDAEKQARHFLEEVKLAPGDLPPVLDLEITSGQPATNIADGALKWMQIVERETGMKPILYTLPKFADSYLRKKLCGYPLWVVDLGAEKPTLPKGWKKWIFWQHSHRGRVPGIRELVDLNRFNGTVEELMKMTKEF
jgi:lysozyme